MMNSFGNGPCCLNTVPSLYISKSQAITTSYVIRHNTAPKNDVDGQGYSTEAEYLNIETCSFRISHIFIDVAVATCQPCVPPSRCNEGLGLVRYQIILVTESWYQAVTSSALIALVKSMPAHARGQSPWLVDCIHPMR
jgi:hypothetical protein